MTIIPKKISIPAHRKPMVTIRFRISVSPATTKLDANVVGIIVSGIGNTE